VAKVALAAAAVEDLDRLAVTLTLPADTRERVRRSLGTLEEFPRLGPELEGRWVGLRFILGPWRWMLIVYQSDEPSDRVDLSLASNGLSGDRPCGALRPELFHAASVTHRHPVELPRIVVHP
jgi:hypothetical protein